ncbi:MAG: hypothetical protein RLZZ373_1039 [Pseudomonadota bacterium]
MWSSQSRCRTPPLPALHVTRWREDLTLHGAQALASFADDRPAITRNGPVRYVAGWLDDAGWRVVLAGACGDAGLTATPLPEGLRVSRAGPLTAVFNFSDAPVRWHPPHPARPILGTDHLPPRGLTLWDHRA